MKTTIDFTKNTSFMQYFKNVTNEINQFDAKNKDVNYMLGVVRKLSLYLNNLINERNGCVEKELEEGYTEIKITYPAEYKTTYQLANSIVYELNFEVMSPR